MNNSDISKTRRWVSILAVVAFLLAVVFVTVKYFRSGEFDFTTLAAGIVIPGLVYILVNYGRET